jgi:hypothetical protein
MRGCGDVVALLRLEVAIHGTGILTHPSGLSVPLPEVGENTAGERSRRFGMGICPPGMSTFRIDFSICQTGKCTYQTDKCISQTGKCNFQTDKCIFQTE